MFSSSFSSRRSFDWLEDKKGSKKTRLPAKQFIDTSLAQIQRQIRDEQTFPTKFGRCIVISLILDHLKNKMKGLVNGLGWKCALHPEFQLACYMGLTGILAAFASVS